MLGPGALTTQPRRPRRRRHQGRAAAGRLRPPDDLADRRTASRSCSCTSAGASAASCSTCAPTRAARRSSSSCATPTRSWRRCARAASSGAGSASTTLREVNPKIVFVHDLGLRHDRPVPRHAEPRHRVRHVGRHRAARSSTTTAFAYMPEHVSIGINAGPGVRRARPARRRAARARDGRGLPARDRAVRRGRRDRLAAQRDVAARTNGPSRRSPATRPTTTNAARPAPRAWRRASATSSTRPPTATCSSWRRSASSGRTSAKASAGPTCSSAGPARSTATTHAATPSCSAILRDDLRRRKSSEEWLAFGLEHNTPIAPSNTPKTVGDDPQFQRPAAVAPRVEGRRRHAAHADQVRRRDAPRCRRRRRRSASTPRQVLRDVLGWDDARIEQARADGAFGTS